MQQLHHQSSKSLKGTGYSHSWADLDEDSLGGVNVYLEFSSLVDWRIEKGKKTLYAPLATTYPYSHLLFQQRGCKLDA